MTNSEIRVFEHDALRAGSGENHLTTGQLKALQDFHGEGGVPYFTLINNGVKFCEYVGVIQVGAISIEVLPKAGREENKDVWQRTLIDMLRSVGIFDVHAPSTSALSLKSNSILELYFRLFIKEVEFLLHSGLVKKYRKVEGNTTALKGSIQFASHISTNLTHKERFYVRHTTYDTNHLIHHILYKTINLISIVSTQAELKSSIGSLLLHFPEMPDIRVAESTFSRLSLNRKTEPYRKSLEIARLLLLNFHPDVRQGRNNVLALMFDMNTLWEKFVYTSIRQGLQKKGLATKLRQQVQRYFWRPTKGSRSSVIPDIVYAESEETAVVLDTKWKVPGDSNPSPADLRQMYVYLHYYKARKVALVYPGGGEHRPGNFLDTKTQKELEGECGMMFIPVNRNITEWQTEIYNQFDSWLKAAVPRKQSALS